MLFEKRFWTGLADGTVTLSYRRWRRGQVLPGRSYRTPAGIIDVSAVTIVEPGSITDAEAHQAGYDDTASLVADLRGDPETSLYRIEFLRSKTPDPRAMLAANDDLSDADIAEIARRLDRLDKASSHGPWTRQTLQLIQERPAMRAPELAAYLGRERNPFKIDVRKLKNLGLTESLAVGYKLSPRGVAYLRRQI